MRRRYVVKYKTDESGWIWLRAGDGDASRNFTRYRHRADRFATGTAAARAMMDLVLNYPSARRCSERYYIEIA